MNDLFFLSHSLSLSLFNLFILKDVINTINGNQKNIGEMKHKLKERWFFSFKQKYFLYSVRKKIETPTLGSFYGKYDVP
jgi:hypothetical protein